MSDVEETARERFLTTRVGFQLHAVVSFNARGSFPLVGPPIFVVEPIPALTLGATFVDTSFPVIFGPIVVMQGRWRLHEPLSFLRRTKQLGFQLGTFPPNPLNIAPLIPSEAFVPDEDTFLQWVVTNDGPNPPPGSPDVFMRYWTQIWTPAESGYFRPSS